MTSGGTTSAGNVATVNKSLNKKPIKRETYHNTQVKGSDPMPKAKKGRTKHPFKGKLVGENMKDQIKEGVLDASDEDGWMAKQQLYKTAQYAIKLHQMIGDTDNSFSLANTFITKLASLVTILK